MRGCLIDISYNPSPTRRRFQTAAHLHHGHTLWGEGPKPRRQILTGALTPVRSSKLHLEYRGRTVSLGKLACFAAIPSKANFPLSHMITGIFSVFKESHERDLFQEDAAQSPHPHNLPTSDPSLEHTSRLAAMPVLPLIKLSNRQKNAQSLPASLAMYCVWRGSSRYQNMSPSHRGPIRNASTLFDQSNLSAFLRSLGTPSTLYALYSKHPGAIIFENWSPLAQILTRS